MQHIQKLNELGNKLAILGVVLNTTLSKLLNDIDTHKPLICQVDPGVSDEVVELLQLHATAVCDTMNEYYAFLQEVCGEN